ncbi:MAG: hypothetical protein DMG57_08895 [Acidobacteria bacterium]|nr:MAG: hypothetical protein DMG57_08895 [Acidobacteriota bacterium]
MSGMAKHFLADLDGACGVDMEKRQTRGYMDACLECRRLDLQARSAVLELTLLEAARRLNRTNPAECDRFNLLIDEAREGQRQSQLALWTHVREHAARESRALASEYVN